MRDNIIPTIAAIVVGMWLLTIYIAVRNHAANDSAMQQRAQQYRLANDSIKVLNKRVLDRTEEITILKKTIEDMKARKVAINANIKTTKRKYAVQDSLIISLSSDSTIQQFNRGIAGFNARFANRYSQSIN